MNLSQDVLKCLFPWASIIKVFMSVKLRLSLPCFSPVNLSVFAGGLTINIVNGDMGLFLTL